jgi:hypothetical protein
MTSDCDDESTRSDLHVLELGDSNTVPRLAALLFRFFFFFFFFFKRTSGSWRKTKADAAAPFPNNQRRRTLHKTWLV